MNNVVFGLILSSGKSDSVNRDMKKMAVKLAFIWIRSLGQSLKGHFPHGSTISLTKHSCKPVRTSETPSLLPE